MLWETLQGTDSSQSTGKVKAGRTGDRSARKFEVSLGYCLPDPKFKKKKTSWGGRPNFALQICVYELIIGNVHLFSF